MYFRLYYKPDCRPHPKRIFDIVQCDITELPIDRTPVQHLINIFRASEKVTLYYLNTRASVDGTYRIITRKHPKEYSASQLDSIQECNIPLRASACERTLSLNFRK